LGGEFGPTWGKCGVRVNDTKSHDVLQDRIILFYIFKSIVFTKRCTLCLLRNCVTRFALRWEREAMGKIGE
jgi:hypothetical protein